MTDPIADMIIRIKNGLLAGQTAVSIPHSRVKESIAMILKQNDYISDFAVQGDGVQKAISVTLRYVGDTPVISGVKRVSKPGRRIYKAAKQIPRTLNGYGLTIVSTNQGLMDVKDAVKKNVGGEVFCQIW